MARTPGPWEVYDPNEGGFPPHPLWCVANDEFHNPTGEDEPCLNVVVECGTKEDALLIAAAPEMYDALHDALSVIRDKAPNFPMLAERMEAALAKARGEG